MAEEETNSAVRRRPRAGVVAGLSLYLLAVAVVLLSPVSYSSIVNRIGESLSSVGIVGFGTGWIEFIANILMFAPLGFFLTLLLRRPLTGMVLSLALSVGAEVAQILIPSRQPSLRDILANVLGAALGAGLAWLIGRRRGESTSRSDGVAEQPAA